MEKNNMTAVEWLFQKMTEQGTNAYWDMRFIQAKQMEKEQIVDAYENGVGDENERNLSGKFTKAEEYYNQTYGQK